MQQNQNSAGQTYVANSASPNPNVEDGGNGEDGPPDKKKKTQINNKRITVSGFNISAGLGGFLQGLEVSIGAFGQGSWKYPYFNMDILKIRFTLMLLLVRNF